MTLAPQTVRTCHVEQQLRGVFPPPPSLSTTSSSGAYCSSRVGSAAPVY